jgi:glutaminyl-tRNA synthetase
MPTIAGLRRRGVTPEAIRLFAELVGVSKANSRVDISKLEFAIREDLNQRVPRVLCVLQPLKVTLTNYDPDQLEEFDAPYYPHDVPLTGSRQLPFTRELYIDREDFLEDPPKGYFRLRPGGEVRLRYAYIIRCEEVIKDASGQVIELKCTYDPATRGGTAPDGRVVKGTIHWVSAPHSLPAEVRLYDRLFTVPDPEQGEDFKEFLNPESLQIVRGARIEPSVAHDAPGSRYQFERVGYFCSDTVHSKTGAPVYNRTVTLRDSWAKQMEARPSEGRPERKPERALSPATASAAHPSDEELIARDPALLRLFQEARAAAQHRHAVAKFLVNELPRELKGRSVSDLPFGGPELAALVDLTEDGTITAQAAREVLTTLATQGGDPRRIVEQAGLRQISDPAELEPLVKAVLEANPDKVASFRSGRTGLLGFFVGQVMARTGGRANPEMVRSVLASHPGLYTEK